MTTIQRRICLAVAAICVAFELAVCLIPLNIWLSLIPCLVAAATVAFVLHRMRRDTEQHALLNFYYREDLTARMLREREPSEWLLVRNRLAGRDIEMGPYVCVLITYEQVKQGSNPHRAVHELAESYAPEVQIISSAIARDRTACVIHGPGVNDRIPREFAKRLQPLVENAYIAVSSSVEDWRQLPELYEQCQQITEYMQFAGWIDSVCTQHDLPPAEQNRSTAALRELAQKISNLKLDEAAAVWTALLQEESKQMELTLFRQRRLPFLLLELADQVEKVRYVNGKDAFDGADLQAKLGAVSNESEAEAAMAWVVDRLRSKLAERMNSQVPEDRVCEYIEAQFSNPDLTVASVAEHFGVSLSYLSANFKRQTGMGVLQYLHRMRVREAARLLRETDMTVRQIVERVGYTSSSTMFRAFTRLIGISPQAYRDLDAAEQAEIRM